MLQVSGFYQGKNLYVQNPFSANGVGFCVYEVRVNDVVAMDETSSSAFEIDLGRYGFKPGDPVTVVIWHKDGCTPKILNPEVLSPRSTFDVIHMQITQQGADNWLQWETKNEQGKLDYIVEQFRWNKWVKLGKTAGAGAAGPNQYRFKVNMHSGENKFRVMQLDYTGLPRASKPAAFPSFVPAMTYTILNGGSEIVFSAETLYEILDQYGNIVQAGSAKNVVINRLPKGNYFLNYDNTMTEFVKKA